MGKSDRIDVYLVAGGKYHDIDHARLEILKLLAEQPRIKVKVGADYSDIDAICESDLIITYTCDISPSEQETVRLCEFIRSGKKWFALHGTNSILRFLQNDDGSFEVHTPEENTPFMEILGSQFISHPPIHEYQVEITEPDHPLVKDIPPFKVDDELYLCKFHGEYQTLLHTNWSEKVDVGFSSEAWVKETDVQPVLYIHPYGEGQVLYLTLGHCRGKYDMQPAIEEYPVPEEGAWQSEEFYELLRRGIGWMIEPIT
ncbi:MAG: type 1 glutamine amidotransferase [Oceanicoccus sp.]|jgi:type 1 glutamine amidotransferase